MKIDWTDINVGRVEEIENATVAVKYLEPGIFFEKVSNDTFQAVLKPEGFLVWIPVERVLHIVNDTTK